MNYRLLLSEMYIDYVERIDSETNKDKREVYKEIIRDLKLALDIEVNQIALIQEVNNILK